MTETDGRRPGDRVTHKLGRAVSLCASALRSSRDLARGYQARLTDAFGRHGKTNVLLRYFALRSAEPVGGAPFRRTLVMRQASGRAARIT